MVSFIIASATYMAMLLALLALLPPLPWSDTMDKSPCIAWCCWFRCSDRSRSRCNCRPGYNVNQSRPSTMVQMAPQNQKKEHKNKNTNKTRSTSATNTNNNNIPTPKHCPTVIFDFTQFQNVQCGGGKQRVRHIHGRTR